MYLRRFDMSVRAARPTVPREMPGSRSPASTPSKLPSTSPLRLMSAGFAHATCPLFGFGLQACMGSPTEKRPSTPKSHVGLVRSRAWFSRSASRPTAKYSRPLRSGDSNGSVKSTSPGAPAATVASWFELPSEILQLARVGEHDRQLDVEADVVIEAEVDAGGEPRGGLAELGHVHRVGGEAARGEPGAVDRRLAQDARGLGRVRKGQGNVGVEGVFAIEGVEHVDDLAGLFHHPRLGGAAGLVALVLGARGARAGEHPQGGERRKGEAEKLGRSDHPAHRSSRGR
jgi:hypothetical protein